MGGVCTETQRRKATARGDLQKALDEAASSLLSTLPLLYSGLQRWLLTRVLHTGFLLFLWIVMVFRFQRDPFETHRVSATTGALTICHPNVFAARRFRLIMPCPVLPVVTRS